MFYRVEQEGSNLIITRARREDSGEYTCSASNMAGERTSKRAVLTVYG